jgi:hypothetical protein
MAQAPPMAQALLVVQTTHANVPASNAKKPKFIMSKKFDLIKVLWFRLTNQSLLAASSFSLS